MKNISVLLLILISSIAYSQHEHDHSEPPEPNYPKLQKQLHLSDDQLEDVKSLHDSFRKDAKKIKDDLGINEEERKKRTAEMRKIHEERLKTLLSDEQYNDWKEMREKRRKKRQHHRHHDHDH